jgi:hypothetical protein
MTLLAEAAKWIGGICFVIGAAAIPFVVLWLSAMANRVQAPVAVDYAAMLPHAAQDQTSVRARRRQKTA